MTPLDVLDTLCFVLFGKLQGVMRDVYAGDMTNIGLKVGLIE